MSKILNLSAHTSDEELQHLTNLLIFHFVEQCGGQIQFKLEDAHRVRESLTTKMVRELVTRLGDPATGGDGPLTNAFPTPAAMAAQPESFHLGGQVSNFSVGWPSTSC